MCEEFRSILQTPGCSLRRGYHHHLLFFSFHLYIYHRLFDVNLGPWNLPSDVMKEMNSETHSWTVSLASLAILAFFGKAVFIILVILAMGRNLTKSI